MGASVSRKDFTFSYSDEPHATRRKLILQKYPQIKQLMVVDRAFKWQVLGLVLAQLVSFFLLKNVTSFWVLFPLAYCIGGVANHAIMLAIHEISHGMAFGTSKPLANKIFAIFANLPLGIPMSISFKKYHLEHHRYQGHELLDTDVPSYMEASFFTNSSRKLLWCILQPFFYTLRPLFVNPKPMERAEMANVLVQLAFDLVIIKALGWHVLAYMVGGSVLAMGLHPVAGHFISEHTLLFHHDDDQVSGEFSGDAIEMHREAPAAVSNELCDVAKQSSKVDRSNSEPISKHLMRQENQSTSSHINTHSSTVDQNGHFLIPETCSYYGPLNWLTFNVGYHVEHHDFPSIPGSKLYRLAEIAPEFYKNLKHHTSWTYVLWQYITDPRVGPSSRVRRPIRQKSD